MIMSMNIANTGKREALIIGINNYRGVDSVCPLLDARQWRSG